MSEPTIEEMLEHLARLRAEGQSAVSVEQELADIRAMLVEGFGEEDVAAALALPGHPA